VRSDEAEEAIGVLAGVTTGWTDEAIGNYARELEHLPDFDALMVACRKIGSSWSEARRPPVAHILGVYRTEVDRKAPRPSFTSQRVVQPTEGVEIAWRAYSAEVMSQGRSPDRGKFERMMGRLIR